MGILHRYILAQLLKIFGLALAAFTTIFVVVGVAQHAMKEGLSGYQILTIIPLIVPGTLPYTVPATVLLAVTVVYGRLAADNEILAAKAAGIGAVYLAAPALILGGVLSLTMALISDHVIPHANSSLTQTLVNSLEGTVYARLKRDQMIKGRSSDMPYEMYVEEVDGRTLKSTFIKRVDENGEYSVLWAREAKLTFDLERRELLISMREPQIFEPGKGITLETGKQQDLTVPLPELNNPGGASPRELTTEGMGEHIRELQDLRDRALFKCAFDLSTAVAVGEFESIPFQSMLSAAKRQERTIRVWRRLRCEPYLRSAISFGCFFFAMLGCPIAILMQKGDYLSAFISCFLPIIGVYYPLVMFGLNIAKEGILPPESLWAGNLLMAAASFVFFRPVIRH